MTDQPMKPRREFEDWWNLTYRPGESRYTASLAWQAAKADQAESAEAMPMRERWNIMRDGSDRLLVCERDHEKSEACHEDVWISKSASEAQLEARDKQIAELREALELYANPDSYFALSVLADRPCGCFADDHSPITPEEEERFGWEDYRSDGGHYYGKTARQALAKHTGNAGKAE